MVGESKPGIAPRGVPNCCATLLANKAREPPVTSKATGGSRCPGNLWRMRVLETQALCQLAQHVVQDPAIR